MNLLKFQFLERPGRLRRGHRPGRHEFLATRIDRQVQAFEAARPEQEKIAFLGEHDLVNRKRLLHPDEIGIAREKKDILKVRASPGIGLILRWVR